MKYREDTEIVLNKLNFIIDAKLKIGIVGRTGAGKSTICLALCRIVEAHSGRILIDNTDISNINLKALRENIAIIPQDPTLFENTLRFNLDMSERTPENEILKIAKD